MIKRKHISEPFESVTIDKKAYDLSNIEPDRFRKEIKNYVENLYPFMSAGLQYVNFKKPPDDNGDAIGSIQYIGSGIEITIPIIVEENNMKEPTVGIYNNHIIPLDKEYIDYVIESPEYGEQIRENELPANMQYITQSGLFQNSNAGVYKSASVVSTIFDEDPSNPYHYYGAVLKKASDNTIEICDNIYCDSASMLKYIKEAEDNPKTSPSSMGSDKRVVDMPTVQKLTDSGRYRNVMMGGDVIAADVMCNLFSIEGGKTKALAYRGNSMGLQSPMSPNDVKESSESWGYGDAYGSGYEGDNDVRWTLGESTDKIDDTLNRYIIFVRPSAIKANSGDMVSDISMSSPYKIHMMESVNYGDSGEPAKILFAESLNNGSRYKFILTDRVGDVRKIDNEKLKNSNLKYLYDEIEDIYLVPENYKIKILPSDKKEMDGYKDGYTKMVREISESYPNTMSIIDKGAGMYTINVEGDGAEYKYANVSDKSALLLANYYTGQSLPSMSGYKTDHAYAFSGDISKTAVDRTGMSTLKKYKGEFGKLAEMMNGYNEDIKKVADIGETVDNLVGIEASIDDEHIDTSNVLQLMDNVISKVGELLLMARLGKNDISESIASRALYAMVKLSNEIRGMSNTNAY